MMDIDWQPMTTAPRDGTWILGINNRGNCAVIIWSNSASDGFKTFRPGWIHPFSSGEISSFWNGSCGSYPVAWAALPRGEGARAIVDKFEVPGRESYIAEQAAVKAAMQNSAA